MTIKIQDAAKFSRSRGLCWIVHVFSKYSYRFEMLGKWAGTCPHGSCGLERKTDIQLRFCRDAEFVIVMGAGMGPCQPLGFSILGAVNSLVHPVSQDFNEDLLHWVQSSEKSRSVVCKLQGAWESPVLVKIKVSGTTSKTSGIGPGTLKFSQALCASQFRWLLYNAEKKKSADELFLQCA